MANDKHANDDIDTIIVNGTRKLRKNEINAMLVNSDPFVRAVAVQTQELNEQQIDAALRDRNVIVRFLVTRYQNLNTKQKEKVRLDREIASLLDSKRCCGGNRATVNCCRK
ncbi:MAG: hypothetical protein M1504_01835 [Candidatus Marsarchaeota archaeon]|nr:hypothetical protein [Candidatus Marsarchaeota archaeon]